MMIFFDRLTGPIPFGLHHLNRLTVFSLKSNFLSGRVPDVFNSSSSNLLVDLSQNPDLIPPLPLSLAKRFRAEGTKILVDSHLFGCPKGYRAPRPDDWETFWTSTLQQVDDVPFRLRSLCQPCPKGRCVGWSYECECFFLEELVLSVAIIYI